jgi:hypothetical protein
MFFFGEFNSCMPYLVYLSLIWFFIIIGCHGKIVEVWHLIAPKHYQVEENVITHTGKTVVFSFQQTKDQHLDNSDVSLYKGDDSLLKFLLCVISPLPDNIIKGPPFHIDSFPFRGPPVLHS